MFICIINENDSYNQPQSVKFIDNKQFMTCAGAVLGGTSANKYIYPDLNGSPPLRPSPDVLSPDLLMILIAV